MNSKVSRRRLTVDDQHVFAERFEHAGHAQLAPQGIAIGPDVAGQQESLMPADDLDQSRPIDAHEVLIS